MGDLVRYYDLDGGKVDGQLKELAGPPDPQVSGRPWLRRLELEGGASFFGGHVDGRPIRATFDFSPDLTCIIGGSMTGKSTLLDGLRCYTEAGLPRDKRLAENVRARGEDIFLAGQPTISLDVSAPDHVAPLAERWPARFFTQNELQRLVEEPEALEDILCRLVPEQTESIEGSRRRLRDLDARLSQKATRLTHLDQQIEEAEQQKRRAEQALAALKAIEEAGYEDLQLAAREASRVAAAAADAGELQTTVQNVEEQVGGLAHGVDPQRLALLWSEVENRDGRPNLEEQAKGLKDVAGTLTRRASEYQESLRLLADSANRNSQRLREKVEGALAAQGYGASKLAEFRALADRAKLVDSYRSALDHANKEQSAAKEAFELGVIERESVEERLRAAFDEVLKRIETEFPERIRARRLKNAGAKSLESFLLALAAKGVTRWWNSLDLENRHSPKELLDALEQQRLDEIGMSDRVRESFRELMTRARQRELAALRSTDLYDLELRLEDGSWRRLAELSGGRQVSVLLSLLLETHDERPLVIDQPEDELDNRFLFKTVLPALRRIKGQRQIIVATHNANIVVNGDADQVILLEASANAGRVAAFGTIEEPSVRDAIVATVDGGGDAFRLRQLKYGF